MKNCSRENLHFEILEGLKVLFKMNSFTQLRISMEHEWFYDSFKNAGRNLKIKNCYEWK